MQEDAQRMSADCAHFSMEEPDFGQLKTVADDIENTKVLRQTCSADCCWSGAYKFNCVFESTRNI